MFRTEGSGDHISGVILFDETIRQDAADGTPLVKVLKDSGIIPGIKVDKGAMALAGAEGEKVTEGLDGLRDRVAEYVKLGAGFAKWRAVITIGDGIPSDYCLDANAHALARYAAICVEGGLVPIVEPEVIMDGGHSIEQCYETTERALNKLFDELYAQRVPLEQILLKPNMVLSGTENKKQAGVKEVAEATLHCFHRAVPAAVPGIVFLSGGQSDELATAHLNEMNKLGGGPWSFRSPMAAPCRPRRSRHGEASSRTSAPLRPPTSSEPSATAPPAPVPTPKPWKPPNHPSASPKGAGVDLLTY